MLVEWIFFEDFYVLGKISCLFGRNYFYVFIFGFVGDII